ncbi:MAG: CCA tRNA nucleotidyltransferase [Actinobacteria bacterium]|nr:CCA tRNA nucleotidyltransferase [Actinomycetota bacterium]
MTVHDERVAELLEGEEAWIVGGAVRDGVLGKRVLDLDVACANPKDAARRFANRFGGASFPLSERHGAWRVVAEGSDETIDFTPLVEGIDADLATRDFTFNAVAVPVAGREPRDPYNGLGDLEAGIVRAVSDEIFVADPLRLLRAARLEDELGFRMDDHTEALARTSAHLVSRAAGERILGELRRLSASGYRRVDELGLLAPLGGSLDARIDAVNDPDFRLVAVFGSELSALPISRELTRYARTLLRASRPDASVRGIHRFRRQTEPWSLHALAFVGAEELSELVEAARAAEPSEPLIRGDELELPPGPEIGRILAAIDEERAAGTISTPDEALALARRLATGGSS